MLCYYCEKSISSAQSKVTLLVWVNKNEKSTKVYAHIPCWKKDLENDSGSYTDRF